MTDAGRAGGRLPLYALLAAVISLFTAIILLLPYETVYVRDEAYLSFFLAVIVICCAVFVLGIASNALLWMRGRGLVGTPEARLVRTLYAALRVILSRKLWRSLRVFVVRAFYISDLRAVGFSRWLAHFLILGGCAAMFVLDLIVTVSLDVLRYGPMIDEDGWAKLLVRDFAFDLVGLAVLVGLCMAVVRRYMVRPKQVRTDASDTVSILFLLAVVAGGFVLEGMGIAGQIPGHTANTEYSFVGYILSLGMPASAGEYYDAAWLVHGVMSALLIAYIPFSKLFHMIASPLAIEVDDMLSEEGGP